MNLNFMLVTCYSRHIVAGQVAFTVTNCAYQEMLAEKLGVKRPGCKYTDLLIYLLVCLLTYLLICLRTYLLTYLFAYVPTC